jgi:ribonuclease Y
MMEYLFYIVFAAAFLLVWYLIKIRVVNSRKLEVEKQIAESKDAVIKDAERLKKERLLEAKDEIFNWRVAAEKEVQGQRLKATELEKGLQEKEQRLRREIRRVERKRREIDQRTRSLKRKETQVEESRAEVTELVEEQTRRLESVAGMTSEDAKKMLIQNVETEARRDAALLAKRIEEETVQKSAVQARKIISQAIQRCAAEHIVESSVSVVDLPSDEMKGRIIGREGRNIRALEQATGVDLIVDDTPEAVILSGFDPLRREIARLSIERLIRDGRIHPARIEEVVSQMESEIETKLREEGEQVAFELGIHNFDTGLLQLLGRLKYRTSYGQNVLNHSRDVAYIAGIMAREIGADVEVAKRGGLLHDIGKAVDRDMEGTHLQLGVEIARKHGESEEVMHAIEAHHFDVEFKTVEAVLVQAADAISAARPGARREVLENYIRRLEKLEELAGSFSGVAKAFALQAGREIRVIVESSKVSDEQSFWLSKDIAKRIEKDLEYPGQVKVTVIREMRVVDYAK